MMTKSRVLARRPVPKLQAHFENPQSKKKRKEKRYDPHYSCADVPGFDVCHRAMIKINNKMSTNMRAAMQNEDIVSVNLNH